MKVAIIADDLTGALDSSVAFAARGWNVMVCLDVQALPAALAVPCDVLAITTQSRGLTEGEAVHQAARAARAIAPCRPSIVFKKIDSQLKGHIAAEIGAVAAIFDRDRIVVSPAVPRLGRTVRTGWLRGHGIETPLGLRAMLAGLPEVEIPDAADEDAFILLAADVCGDSRRVLAVGASSFAAALADCLAGDLIAPAPARRHDRILFAVGSLDEITAEQVRRLRASGETTVVRAPDGEIAVPSEWPGGTMLIQCTSTASRRSDETHVARRFARGIATVIADHDPSLLVVSGGDTAHAIMQATGIDLLRPFAEFAPGVPISNARLRDGRELQIVTKSGGFGGPEILVDIARHYLAAGPHGDLL